MDDRNKDLPLIVSEILIEMHEMKEDIREMKNALNRMAAVVSKQQEHTNSLFTTIQDENGKNMQFIATILETSQQDMKVNMEAVRKEAQATSEAIRQEAQEDREFMTYSINKALGQQQQTNADFEKRILQLEAKYNG